MDVKEVIVKPKSKKIKKKNINDPTSNFETKKDFFVYLDDIQQNNPILFKKITDKIFEFHDKKKKTHLDVYDEII